MNSVKEVEMKSRFIQELSGDLGDYWEKHAEEKLAEMRSAFGSGKEIVNLFTSQTICL